MKLSGFFIFSVIAAKRYDRHSKVSKIKKRQIAREPFAEFEIDEIRAPIVSQGGSKSILDMQFFSHMVDESDRAEMPFFMEDVGKKTKISGEDSVGSVVQDENDYFEGGSGCKSISAAI